MSNFFDMPEGGFYGWELAMDETEWKEYRDESRKLYDALVNDGVYRGFPNGGGDE